MAKTERPLRSLSSSFRVYSSHESTYNWQWISLGNDYRLGNVAIRHFSKHFGSLCYQACGRNPLPYPLEVGDGHVTLDYELWVDIGCHFWEEALRVTTQLAPFSLPQYLAVLQVVASLLVGPCSLLHCFAFYLSLPYLRRLLFLSWKTS